MNPQLFGPLMDGLLAAGALDVFYTPVQMKKNRPGTLVTVIAPPDRRQALIDVLFRTSTTIGVRYEEMSRACLDRAMESVDTPYGAGAVQDRAPQRRGAERRAGVRRLRSHRRRARRRHQGRSGRRHQGPPRPRAINRRMSRFYLTTAIDYVNSRPHLGTAYEKITADVIARYKRLRGAETWFVMGNDEHSQNVYRRAREEGLDPLAYCDRMEEEFRSVWDQLDVSYDDFIRTTQPRHRAAVQELIRRIRAAGDVYEGTYEGWYCIGCEAFKQEKDLVDGRCPLHGAVEWITEKNHFFRLSAYRRQAPRSISRRIRSFSSRTSGGTRSCGCSRRASRTSRSAAPASRGASRCPTIPTASSMSGSTR